MLALLAVPAAAQETGLKPVSAFDAIEDEAARSVAFFEETGRVLQHPRCVNFHPGGDSPLQNIAMTPHQRPVVRGQGGMGARGMMCGTCHGPANVEIVAQAEGSPRSPAIRPGISRRWRWPGRAGRSVRSAARSRMADTGAHCPGG